MTTFTSKILTKIRSFLQGINLRNVWLWLFIFVGFLAPYSHIVFNKTEVEGIFGFSLMSSFLFAIGFPISMLSCSYLLWKAASYMPNILKSPYIIFSYLTAFTGFYFIVWAVNPFVTTDFHPLFYYGSMVLISLSLIKTVHMVKDSSAILKEKIRYLMNVIVIKIKDGGHIKDQKKYDNDIVIKVINKVNEK